MKKGAPFRWDGSCQKAYDNIKSYLLSPPALRAPVPSKPLLLYIAAQECSLGALHAQENSEGREKALYYRSHMLVGIELNYSPIKKMCLALMFPVQKLRNYMQAHIMYLISKANTIKYILSRPVLHGLLAKWALILEQYDLIYVSQKTTEGQALTDYLVNHPIPEDWELTDDLQGEEIFFVDVLPSYKMFFDDATQPDGAGAGVMLVSLETYILPYSFILVNLLSNNVAEYQALILGLQIAIGMGIKDLHVYGDSQLVIYRLL